MFQASEISKALAVEWLPHESKALAEGWILTEMDRSMWGPLQVQRIDDAAGIDKVFPVPQLDSDDIAWSIVVNGTGAHHEKARELLQRFNPDELERYKGNDPLNYLIDEYGVWLKQAEQQGIPERCALENLHGLGETLTDDQKDWLADFIRRWEQAERASRGEV
jgi:hypothetical protein